MKQTPVPIPPKGPKAPGTLSKPLKVSAKLEGCSSDENSSNATEKRDGHSNDDSPSEVCSEESYSSNTASSDESGGEHPGAADYETASATKSQTTRLRPRTFQPPPGFRAAECSLSPSSNLAKLLRSTDVSKQHIWHITAPAMLDVKQIKKLAYGTAAPERPAMEHGGADFALIADETGARAPKTLLVPSEEGYSAVPVAIAASLRLQQIVELPKLHHADARSTASTGAIRKFVERPEKAAKRQPEGLRMRYRPLGYSGAACGIHDAAIMQKRRRQTVAELGARAKKSGKRKTHREMATRDA